MGFNLGNVLNGKKGPGNPFSAPDESLLKNTGQYDFLKGDTWKSPTAATDSNFSSWLDSIKKMSAPTSVDAVRSRVNSDAMTDLLTQIDQNTRKASGSLKMDFLERGLGGPGMLSSMESLGLGQTYSAGAQQKADAQTKLAMSELDAMTERDRAVSEMLNNALGSRYSTGAQRDLTEMGIKNQRELSLADILSGNARALYGGQSSLYNAGEQRKQAGEKGSIFEDILRNTNISIPIG